ncbi:Pentatricopeptide repeat-containing protein At2g38420, mitochondrial [Linum grandiflorum]
MPKTSQLHHIPPLLDHLEKTEIFETPELILADLIKLYCESNQIEKAVDIFFRIPNFRCAPTAVSLNTLLGFLCRTKSGLKKVPEVLLKSREMNIRVEESSFRILITALCRVNRVSHAIEMFHRMIDDGIIVGEKICSFLLSSLCEQRDVSSGDVIGFFGELRKLGFVPGLIDYTILQHS